MYYIILCVSKKKQKPADMKLGLQPNIESKEILKYGVLLLV